MRVKIALINTGYFFGVILAAIMYLAVSPIHPAAGVAAGALTGGVFFAIVRDGKERFVRGSVFSVLAGTIRRSGNVAHSIELLDIPGGMLARIYLFDEEERFEMVRTDVTDVLEDSDLQTYVKAVQIANVSGSDDYREMVKKLDRGLTDLKMERGRSNWK